MSNEADVHTNEAGSNVGYRGIICPPPPIHATLSGEDIVEAQLSQLVPIDEWYWLLGDEDGESVDQAGGYPQSSGSVFGAPAFCGNAIYADQFRGLVSLEEASANLTFQTSNCGRNDFYFAFDCF